ncbi:MAG: class I SAM-dependent methyltransferase [Planctomycetes bacterium]|nr:class I SAM-dependent methyltransferase [Planctomycetota bacterium]
MAKAFPKRNYALRRPVGAKHDEPERRGSKVAPDATWAAPTAWEGQAAWYDQLHGDDGDDFYARLILPSVIERLRAKRGERILDLCCGQGVCGRALAALGVDTVGIDASPTLIAAATARAGKRERYVVGDCRDVAGVLAAEKIFGAFDHATLVMALQDLDPIGPVLAGCAAAIKPGGRVVIALTHPCFRIPRRSSWGWDDEQGLQYRRMDGYLSPLAAPIKTHPGRPADAAHTTSFHRPLSAYLNACGDAGLAVIGADELCSHRRGTKGPRFGAEDRAAKEFPVFLVIAAVRR